MYGFGFVVVIIFKSRFHVGEFLFPAEAQLIQKLNLESTVHQARWDSGLAQTTVTQKEEKMEKLETR